MDDADRPLHRHTQIPTWIDGEAHAAENESRGSDDKEDDAETDIRRWDERDFNMPAIVAGHEAQLRSQERYRIPEDLLQPAPSAAGSSRPPPLHCLRQESSRPPLPPSSRPLPNTPSTPAAASPAFIFPLRTGRPVPCTPLFLPWTPERTPEPQYSQDAPASHAPALSRARTPSFDASMSDWASRSPSHQSSPQLPAKRARLHDADDPAVQRFRRVSDLLDLAALDDSDEETSNAEGDEDLELDQDDLARCTPPNALMAPIAEEDVARLAQIAALYEEEADGYAEAALLEQAGVAEMSPAATLLAHDPTVARAVQDAVDAVMLRPAPTLPPKLLGLVVPACPSSPAASQKPLCRSPVARTPAWTDKSQQEKEKQPQKKRDHHNFVEPGTWIRLRAEDTQQHTGLLAFTMSETWCIVARHQPVETTPFNLDDGDLLRRDDGTESAIQLGDRVVVYRGVHAGLAGYVVHIKDVLVKNPDSSSVQWWVTMMRISTRFPGTTRDISELPGGWVQLGQLRRHVLCPSPPLRLFDRVRIIGNRDAMFLPFGYVTNIADAKEHAALVAVEEENGTSALVPLHNVERCFEEGDRVVVRRGPERNRQGIVVARHLSVLEIFDVVFKSQGAARMLENMAEMTTTDALMQRHTFVVRVSDVDFAMFNEYSAVYPNECSHLVVPQLNAPLPVAQLSPDARRAADRRAREDDARAASDEKTALQAALQTLNAIAPPETLQHLQDRISYFKNGLKKMVKDQQDLIKGVGRRYEGLQVVVVGVKKKMDMFNGLCKGSVWKGHWGIVVGNLDSPERAARLSEQTLKKRWYMRADTRGIMVTVKEQDGRHFTEKIEKLVHEATGLPLAQAQYLPPTILSSFKLVTPQLRPQTPTPPPDEASDWTLPDVPSDYESHRIPGESNGKWLCDPSLTDKRVDIMLRGIGRMVKTRHWNPSALLMGLEGSTGYLLLEEAITPTSLQSQKITVYGVGKTLRKHDVPGQYIQPLRQNNNGTPVTRLQQRVIVLGADLTGDRTAVGSYAQMRPDIKHPHGDDAWGTREGRHVHAPSCRGCADGRPIKLGAVWRGRLFHLASDNHHPIPVVNKLIVEYLHPSPSPLESHYACTSTTTLSPQISIVPMTPPPPVHRTTRGTTAAAQSLIPGLPNGAQKPRPKVRAPLLPPLLVPNPNAKRAGSASTNDRAKAPPPSPPPNSNAQRAGSASPVPTSTNDVSGKLLAGCP
ncbi:hypothetical protein B0H17DRAFT_1145974 [Mycena rosella]|uniref:KOW domain-containing protein n=1 Tax=Mycena rosella TaxID=1033263 RepID=A0AAD7CPV0_MYCRO|nr:hypothetical protein B0H17DRAFT_1145974 [Mycena rosella]